MGYIMDDKLKSKSLAKAFAVLECFIDEKQLGITELSKLLGRSKSSIYDYVSTLEALGYLEQDSSTGKYFLGFKCVRLGRAAMVNHTFRDAASKHIRDISDETGEVCYLTVPYGYAVYFLDVATPRDNRLFSSALPNTADAMNCTGSGKCMLAASPDSFVEDYIAHGLTKLTENSIVDPERLREEVRLIRERGYAIDEMEYSIGIRCVARAIISLDGALIGAISISGPSPRMTDEKIHEYAELLKRHIQELVHSI